MRINRKDIEMGVEGKNLQVHQINKQSDVLKTAAESLGKMGSGDGGGGSLDMGSMMASMTLGGAIGTGMAGMMGSMMNGINTPQAPPPIPNESNYNIAMNGQSQGPFNMIQLQQMIISAQINATTLVWKAGFANWTSLESVDELKPLLNSIPPPISPVPPII